MMLRKLSCTRIDGDRHEPSVHEIVEEMPVALFVNGRHAMTAMISPGGLEEFATGYLFTEQIIKSVDEIESIRIEKNRISVLTADPFKVPGTKKTILSGCGGSVSYIDTEKMPSIHSDFSLPASKITEIAQEILHSDLHVKTGGIHIAGLADSGGVIRRAEDIGRHNALDRLIGFGLRTGIDFSRTFVITSGRISSEMVRKCLIAGIPIIGSRGATTTLSVEIAEKNGLCVIAFVRGKKMIVYTHPERVEG